MAAPKIAALLMSVCVAAAAASAPSDITEWAIADVAEWATKHSFDGAIFTQAGVDGKLLWALTDGDGDTEELQMLGLSSAEEQRRFVDLVQEAVGHAHPRSILGSLWHWQGKVGHCGQRSSLDRATLQSCSS